MQEGVVKALAVNNGDIFDIAKSVLVICVFVGLRCTKTETAPRGELVNSHTVVCSCLTATSDVQCILLIEMDDDQF